MREEEKDIGLETDAKTSVREESKECQTAQCAKAESVSGDHRVQ